MDSINSISKGTFLFANGKDIKQLKRKKASSSKNNEYNQEWYQNFQYFWDIIEAKIEKIQSESYERTLSSLLKYIHDANTGDSNLQTAVLMTGVNQIDHFKQFDLLSQKISNNCFSIVTILKSRDCSNIKYTIEALVAGLIYGRVENDEDDDENIHVKLKKKQLTLSVLEAWYNNRFGSDENKPKLTIMLADFEQFPPHVMQDLVSILCSYSSRLPIVLIIGLATAFKTLHSVLPFHITNKISVNIFQAESSSSMLNRILDEVILTHHCPFFLSGKSFKILIDIFLFYDYSLQSFIQGFKVFMLEQYSTNFFASLYTLGSVYSEMIEELSHENCEWLRRNCMTFRHYVENHEDPQLRIDLITKDEKLKQFIPKKASRALRFYFQFFCCLRMLAILIEDLPRNNLGKQLRELYPICAETEITKLEEFQECFKLLRFTSKDKFLGKLDKIIRILNIYIYDEIIHENLRNNFTIVRDKLLKYRVQIFEAKMTPVKSPEATSVPSTAKINTKGVIGRHEMLQKLKESAMNQPTKIVVEYDKHLCECLDYIYDVFERHLVPFNKGPVLTELFLFSDCNSVRRHIVGAPRSSIHNALVNPHHYLQCKCCTVKENEQILSTMPDISIAYKLHLECNKFINLFDWLQSFSMVIDNNNNDEEENISPEIQAKFTRSVAELQFLGFIKQAKQKTDHVMRLTW
ncbi:origin recognition complex subunit 3 [Chironomus tepperi]|uniref:origin recognition complex subunit 3 n=1 Tax=Chironomus tepperi TaxID=113505 RepID=UPI00391F54A2